MRNPKEKNVRLIFRFILLKDIFFIIILFFCSFWLCMVLSQRSYSYLYIPCHLLKKEINVDASNSQKETIVTDFISGKNWKKKKQKIGLDEHLFQSLKYIRLHFVWMPRNCIKKQNWWEHKNLDKDIYASGKTYWVSGIA